MNTLTLALALALLSPPRAQEAPELLYASGGGLLRSYNPVTGEELSSTYVPGFFSPRGLVHVDGRLLTIDQNILLLRDQLVEVHPATMRQFVVGETGYSLNSGFVSLVRDPTDGRVYAQFNESFWEVDASTGEISYLSRIEPFKALIRAIAIDSNGRVVGFSLPWVHYPEAAFWDIDLESGRLTLIGHLQGNPLAFTCLAFDSSDTLWGAGYGPFDFVHYRLHRIDLEDFTLETAFPIEVGMTSIAFGPAPDVETYCTAKTNSAFCVPEIAWSGLPSATAHFGFKVTCSDVVNQAPGLLMLGLGGAASVPFEGGTLCVSEPILRTTPQGSGGSSAGTLDCSGTWELDVNSWLFANHPLEPGTGFTCQWWGRDPGMSGRASSQLSAALEVVLFP